MLGHALYCFKKLIFISLVFVGLPLSAWADFSVMTWNIHKGSHPAWTQILMQHPTDVLLLQEATTDPRLLLPLETALGSHFSWMFNPAWIMSDGYGTGTLNSSKFEMAHSRLLVSLDVEPIAATPKSMLIADYLIPGCGQVRFINLHMINFNLGAAYRNQLEQLRQYVDSYPGPLVVSGDFNDWNIFRSNTLHNWADSLDLLYVDTARYKWLVLDHIFYKNMDLKSAVEIPTDYSDHHPLRAEFQCRHMI